MKTTNFIMALLAVSAMAISCQREEMPGKENKNSNGSVVTLTACLPEEDAETKANSDGNIIKWNTSAESMLVFADVSGEINKYKFTKDANQGTTPLTAVFTNSAIPDGAVLKYAVYPYPESVDDYSLSGDVLSLDLPTSHTYSLVSSVPTHVPLAGKISGSSVNMKSLCAYLKVTLPTLSTGDKNTDLYSVAVEAVGIGGGVSADFSSGEPAVTTSETGSIKITAKLKNSSKTFGYCLIPVTPGTYDNIKVTLNYTADSGFPSYSRTSTASQTFERNKIYDCGTFDAPYIESVTTSAFLDETTLSVMGNAILGNVAAGNYSMKISYREAGTDTWTDVIADQVTKEDCEFSFSSEATVDASKTYECKTSVSVTDGSVTKEVEGTVLTAVGSLCFDVSSSASDLSDYVYDTTVSAELNGYMKVVTSEGADKFPDTKVSGTGHTYYKKVWGGTAFGETEYVYNSGDIPKKFVGGTLSKTASVGGSAITQTICFPETDQYYTRSNSKLCFNKTGYSIRLECPAGYAISKIHIELLAGTNNKCHWGLGDAKGMHNLVTSVDYCGGVKTNPASHDFIIANPVAGTDYWLYSGAGGNRLQILTISYVK